MSINYKDVLNRLMEERERMSWSQREICQHISGNIPKSSGL